MIRGETVVLLTETVTGHDAFNAPIVETVEATVENVLVTPVDNGEIVSDRQLEGRRIIYELCIPKGDTHVWENKTVRIRGVEYKTFGTAKEYIEANVPLLWNKQIRCGRYE